MPRLLALPVLGLLALAGPAEAAKPAAPPPPDPTPVVTPDPTAPPPGQAAPTRTVTMGPSEGARGVPTAAQAPSAPETTAAPPGPLVLARAELCLRQNAETAARGEASAKLATDFLLEDLCGAEVEAASLYERNLEALARFNPQSERGRAGLSTARVDEETGRIVNPPNVDVASALREAEPELMEVSPSARLRKLAASLVLDERARAAVRRTR